MTKCFLDLDGVLADFVCGALKFHGKQMAYADVRWNFHESIGLSVEEFWSGLGERFWHSLDRTPEFDGIVQSVMERFDNNNIFILSSPCQTAGCITGKARWVEKYLPQVGGVFLTIEKEMFAGHGILIDDHEVNCDKWEKAGGGRAFLFPRPWNMQRDEEPRAIENLRTFLSLQSCSPSPFPVT